jgi:hypothetical protein
VKPRRPYLLRALHEWISDSGETPHIVVDATALGVSVPRQHVKDGKIVLNVSFSATQMLKLGNDFVSFEARFAGVAYSVPIPRTDRRPHRAPGRMPASRRSVRNCKWSSNAKRVFDPIDALRLLRRSLHREHIEAHRVIPPPRLPLQKEPGGARDLALLARRQRGERPAEVHAAALAHFDDHQDSAVEAQEIEFARLAAQVALDDDQAARLEVPGRELFRCGAALQS